MILPLYNVLVLAAVVAALVWLRRRPDGRRAVGAGAGVATVAAALALALGRRHFESIGMAAWGVFAHAPLYLAAAATMLWKRQRRPAVALAVAALAILAVAVDAFLIEPHWLQVSHVRLADRRIARPVKIAVLADIQIDRLTDYTRAALARTMEARPDLILLAGDYIQAPRAEAHTLRRALRQALLDAGLSAPLGVFAVRGNVDDGRWYELFEGTGYTVVHRTESFDLGPLVLTCLTADDSFDVEAALPAVAADKYHVALGHSPAFALGPARADLMIAGHTHGGQVRLPLFGPLTTLSSVPRRFGAGLSARPAGGKLLVSRGIGLERGAAPRLRFLCRPELLFVELHPAEEPR